MTKVGWAGVVILGQGKHRICCKLDSNVYKGCKLVPNVYKVWIPEIEEENFFIHSSNFRVDTPPCPDLSTIFPDEQQNAPPPAEATNAKTTIAIVNFTRELHISSNVCQNFQVGGQEEDLCFQGIEINDDNNPVIENAGLPPSTQTADRWMKPSICRTRSSNSSNYPENWRIKSWSDVADMHEFALLQIMFSDSFVIEGLISQTSKNIEGEGEELKLSEFYVWMDVNFWLVVSRELPTAEIGVHWIQLQFQRCSVVNDKIHFWKQIWCN